MCLKEGSKSFLLLSFPWNNNTADFHSRNIYFGSWEDMLMGIEQENEFQVHNNQRSFFMLSRNNPLDVVNCSSFRIFVQPTAHVVLQVSKSNPFYSASLNPPLLTPSPQENFPLAVSRNSAPRAFPFRKKKISLPRWQSSNHATLSFLPYR